MELARCRGPECSRLSSDSGRTIGWPTVYKDLMVARAGETLLRTLAESEEIKIETRRDSKSPLHRTTIWIVPTGAGVFIRSGSRTGRWYREALANRKVTIRVGRRTVAARVEPESDQSVIRAVNAAYRDKYGAAWPDSVKAVVQRTRLHTTLRLTATGA